MKGLFRSSCVRFRLVKFCPHEAGEFRTFILGPTFKCLFTFLIFPLDYCRAMFLVWFLVTQTVSLRRKLTACVTKLGHYLLPRVFGTDQDSDYNKRLKTGSDPELRESC